jgi:hypothetical protein
VKGEQLVTFTINGETYSYELSVCDFATDADAIMGTDFLKKMKAILNLEAARLCLKKVGSVGHNPLKGGQCGTCGTATRAAFTGFSRPDSRTGRQKSCWIGWKVQKERSPNLTEIISHEIQ